VQQTAFDGFSWITNTWSAVSTRRLSAHQDIEHAALRLRRLFLDPTAPAIHEKGDDRSDQEYYKQDLCNSSGGGRNAAEAKQSSYESDDKKYNSVMKHGRSPCNDGI
jgi:hypothetical protein